MSDSIFKKSVSAFFVSLFAVGGIVVGLVIATVALLAVIHYSEEESFSSSVKLMPDADFRRKELPQTTPILLQINIKGTIGKDDLKASKVETLLLKSREDDFKNDRVKGILLVIDSPGGDANDSDMIYRMLKSYKERFHIPIYAYIDGICASGGFYLACAADKIYGSEVSLIGSIGVLSWPPFFNCVDLLNKWGVETKTLTAGIGKDEMNPFRPWKEDEDKNHRAILDFYYDRFVAVVTENRPQLSREKLVTLYGAHLFPAPQAQEQGYIDVAHATRAETLKALVAAAGLQEEEKYQVVAIESKEWFQKLWKDQALFKIELPDTLFQRQDHPAHYLYRQ